MKLNRLLFLGPVAERRGDALHHQLLLRDGPVARVPHFPSAGPPQNLCMLLYGRRPSFSFSRMRVWFASASILRGSWLGSGECCTLYVPEGEAPHVELKGREVVADTLHGELGLPDDFITRDTAFAVAGTASRPFGDRCASDHRFRVALG